jgi:hypothetical protein
MCERLFYNLKKNNTECSIQFLDQMEALTKRALTGHIIENPVFGKTFDKSYGVSEEEFEILSKIQFSPQENGQLMGSIVSFPFLCIANAAMCRISIEIANGRRYGLDTLPATHNGDDCVLRGRKDRLFPTWDTITRRAGLVNSVGKTYDSKEFCCMNSVHYDYHNVGWEEGGWLANPYRERKYPNLGLIYGQDKSGCRSKTPGQLGSVHQDLHRTIPSFLQERADRMFFSYNGEKLQLVQPLPWFVPEWCGGVGLFPYKKKKLNGTDAIAIFSHMRNLKHNQNFWNSYRPLKDSPEWRMWNLAKKELGGTEWLGEQAFHRVTYEGTMRDLQSETQDLTAALITELIFTKPLEGSSKALKQINLYSDVDAWYNLEHNKTVWRINKAIHNKDISFWKGFRRYTPTLESIKSVSYHYSIPCFNAQLAVLGTPFGELLR